MHSHEKSIRLSSLLLFITFGALSFGQTAPSMEARRKALNDLIAEQWEFRLRTNPVFASSLGDKRWNDQVDDFSQEAIDKNLVENKKFLDRFEAIDTTGFPVQEKLNKRLMIHDLRDALEDASFKSWEMPVTQLNGVHLDLPSMC